MAIYLLNRRNDRLYSNSPSDTFHYPTSSENEYLAFVSRVTSDGGTVVSKTLINNAIKNAKANSFYDSNLLCWYSANFAYKNNGSEKASVLYDLTTNNNDVTQSDSNYMPTYTTAVQNGYPGIYFNSDYMTNTFASAVSQPMTMYIVLRKTITNRCGYVDGLQTGYRNSILDGLTPYIEIYAGSAEKSSTIGTYTNTSIFSAVFNGEDSVLYKMSNLGVTSGSPGTNTLTGIRLGSTVDPIYLVGYLFEFLLSSGSDSEARRLAIVNYLSSVWGIYS